MKCPKCGAITEVMEKRGSFRTRHCMNPDCNFCFITCENLATQEEQQRRGAKARNRRIAQGDFAPVVEQKAAAAS